MTRKSTLSVQEGRAWNTTRSIITGNGSVLYETRVDSVKHHTRRSCTVNTHIIWKTGDGTDIAEWDDIMGLRVSTAVLKGTGSTFERMDRSCCASEFGLLREYLSLEDRQYSEFCSM